MRQMSFAANGTARCIDTPRTSAPAAYRVTNVRARTTDVSKGMKTKNDESRPGLYVRESNDERKRERVEAD